MAPAGHVAVQPVKEKCEGCHSGGGVEMRLRPALQVQHGEKHGADAAGSISEGEEVREMEAADHREMLRFGLLLQGRQHINIRHRVAFVAARPSLGYRTRTSAGA